MPELPEVETIRRQLARKLVGKILGKKQIVGVRRRAKILVVEFADKTASRWDTNERKYNNNHCNTHGRHSVSNIAKTVNA